MAVALFVDDAQFGQDIQWAFDSGYRPVCFQWVADGFAVDSIHAFQIRYRTTIADVTSRMRQKTLIVENVAS